MEPISQFNQNNPDIIGHCQKHLAKAFSLSGPGAVKRKTAEFGNTRNDVENFRPEKFFDFLRVGRGVLDHIMQKTGRHADHIQFHVTQDSGHLQRMGQIRFSGQADLTFVHPGGKNISPFNDIQIRLRMVFRNPVYDVVDSDQCWFSLVVVRYSMLDASYQALAAGTMWYKVEGVR